MKISASTVFLAAVGPASAFVTRSSSSGSLPALRMSDNKGGREEKWVELDSNNNPMNAGNPALGMSKSMPFMKWPAHLDGTLPGDAGFDPLGLGKTPGDLTVYRESEIKHARLAMLAAAGWPVSELFDKKIALLFGLTPALDAAGRVPSVLNGGMGKISPFYWLFCLALAAGVDLYGLNRAAKTKGYVCGDLGFDPLGLKPKDEKGQQWMRTAEIKNGRLAMIAITAFAAQEFVSHIAVVDQVPFLFKPIWQVLSESTNNGYIIPSTETAAPIVDAVNSAVDAVGGAASTLPTIPETLPTIPETLPTIPEAVNGVITPIVPPADTVSSTAAAVESRIAVAPSAPARPVVDEAELIAAKQRIAELELKLNQISNLSR